MAPSSWRSLAARADWSRIGAAVAVGAFCVVAFVLYNTLEEMSWAHVREAASAVSWPTIATSALAAAASYVALVGYDVLALRQVGARNVPLATTALTSFIAHAFTFTMGFGILTGSAVRMRFYRAAKLDTDQILAVGALCALTFWTGLAAVVSLCLVLEPHVAAALVGIDFRLCLAAGACLLVAFVAWIVFTAAKAPVIEIAGRQFQLPGPGASAASLIIGMADTAAAATALWLLLPANVDISLFGFLVIFSLATVLGVVSHVPGGLGVFDATILLGLPKGDEPAVLVSLLLFRLIYYIAPLVLAASLLAFYEVRARHQAVGRRVRRLAEITEPLLPPVAAISVFLGGFVLLVSGALPAEQDRMAILHKFVPLPFVETSHFIASIVGALLLVVAHGLAHRLRSAWRLAVVLLGCGAVFSLAKGFDFEEAAICSAVVVLLFASRRGFYRRGGFLASRPSPEGYVTILVAVAASIWIGLAVYRGVTYDSSLWWHFAYSSDAPRFMRATVGAAVITVIIAAYQLLHRAPWLDDPAPAADLEKAKTIAAAAPQAGANLALLGDKRFLFSEAGDGFLMYGVKRSSWIAMGDPISSDPNGVVDLVWRFKEVADEHRGVPIFYLIGTDNLPAYLDSGFSLVKLGEEAWVDLRRFTLEGGEGRKLRQTKAKAERSGVTLEIIPAGRVAKFFPALKRVSDAWLAERGKREKGFSLGFWSEAYLTNYDHVIIRHEGRIAAFANIWKTKGPDEYSVDLMRHAPDAPHGVMDLLFITLMEKAKAEGYHWFNLGMAPLSGLPDHRLATRWTRFASLLFRFGNRFYSFEGLRRFKAKFNPEWRPRYLAYARGALLSQVLIDVTTLVSSSPRRAIAKEECCEA